MSFRQQPENRPPREYMYMYMYKNFYLYLGGGGGGGGTKGTVLPYMGFKPVHTPSVRKHEHDHM